MKVRFRFLIGDLNWLQYGGKWISTQKFNNGDFDFYFVIELINTHEETGEINQEKYHVNLQVVSPQEAGKENLDKAFEYCGITEENLKQNEVIQVEVLSSYGVTAQVWSKNGNNADKLMNEAKKEASLVNFLFGFYMDRQANRIGSTNWDFIRGNILAGLDRNRQTA